MVMQYMPERDLRHYLSKNTRELKEKLTREKELVQEIEFNKKQFQKKEILEIKKQELDKLRSEIDSFQSKLSLQNKLNNLVSIAQGLKDIHQKDLVHRDFHSGNILKGIEKTACLITDLGLCKPVNEAEQENKIYGVLPYIAPEVLYGKPYTQASDIYSFGIVAYEIFSGSLPYHDVAHDVYLAVKICQGLRPQFNIKIPPLLKNLINRC